MRILHVFRTPLGGLFRHVRDMARGQQELGHEVGLLCNSSTGGESAAAAAIGRRFCSLGIKRIPISRLPGIGDLSGARQTLAHAASHQARHHPLPWRQRRRLRPACRLAAWAFPPSTRRMAAACTINGDRPPDVVFLGAEWLLARMGCGFHFVCDIRAARVRQEDRAWRKSAGGHPQRPVAGGTRTRQASARCVRHSFHRRASGYQRRRCC